MFIDNSPETNLPTNRKIKQERCSSLGLLSTLLLICLISDPANSVTEKFANDRESILRSLLNIPLSVNSKIGKPKSLSTSTDNVALPVEKIPVIQAVPGAHGLETQIAYTEHPNPIASVNLKFDFDLNSAKLKPSAQRLLNALGEALSDHRLATSRISINGHTDSSGSEQYNLKLSYSRAKSVRDFLTDRFRIDTNRLPVFGFGESLPLNNNITVMDRQVNRRVEIALLLSSTEVMNDASAPHQDKD